MLIPIHNAPRAYSWGSPNLIAELEGRTPSGAPEAEIWYGAHPGSPSLVSGGDGDTLDRALEASGEPPLPFLLKILAAGSSLSIQAHPTKSQAEAGFAREEDAGVPRDADDRLYRDDNHKPEIIVALSDQFRALVGLRPPAATRSLLAALTSGVASTPGPALVRLDALLAATQDEDVRLRAALEWALTQASVVDVRELTDALERAGEGSGFDEEIAVLRAAARDFPGDRGLFVALLMNLVVLRRGEALFAAAGVLHAYQSGLGVELMAASDNVLRGGLTPKHVDVPELLRVLDASAGPAPVVSPRILPSGAVVYDVGVPDFALTRVELAGAPARLELRGAAIVLATAGAVSVSQDAESVELTPGRAAYVGGGADGVELSGTGEVFVAQSGRV